MKKNIKEWMSVQLAQKPGRIVLFVIFVFNLILLTIAATVISNLAVSGTEKMPLFEAAFYTITMILDPGCIQFVINDIGQSGIVLAIVCLMIIIIGMVSFTGAVIGYITNYISDFIANSNAGLHKIYLSNHFVILNWNTRASEIINDLLYCHRKQNVIVLVEGGKEDIAKEIEERISDTIHRENVALREKIKCYGMIKREHLYFRDRLKRNINIIIREGDVYSAKQLHDISLEKANSIVILGKDYNRSICKLEHIEKYEEYSRGNAQTIKTLMQVSDITSSNDSADDQKIIVEVSDDWTWEIVQRIIKYKQRKGKCNIVPVSVNQVLGQLLSQFSLMPELNLVYKELFSNKGVTFYVDEKDVNNDIEYITEYLNDHRYAIPLTSMKIEGEDYFYYSAKSQKDIEKIDDIKESPYSVKLNRNYWIEKKTVIILGHNSKCKDIMQGFCAFRSEWNYKDKNDEILQIIVVDDQKSLERFDYYNEYPFVTKTVAASIYDNELICSTIEEVVNSNEENTSILILSDDSASNENIDANVLANLVYVQNIISAKKQQDPEFDTESIDVIVEIIDPKHHDIVSSYSIDNVVISNRYISKMITQIGEKEAIFDFYKDVLTYDDDTDGKFESKEIYTKKVSTFFEEVPKKCTVAEFIRAVWFASIDKEIPIEKQNPTIALGYVKPGGKIKLFGGDQADDSVELDMGDKIIVFTNH